MDSRTTERNEVMEIDIQRLMNAVGRKFWRVILTTVLASVIAFLVTFFLITPKYESSAMFYVNNNPLSVGEGSFSITSSDITASKSLVDSYIVILQTPETLNEVIRYAGVNRTYKELLKMISAEDVNSTEIFRVVVTSEDPNEAEQIANAIAYILPKRIASIIEGSSAKVVDPAVVPLKPSSPSYPVNVLIGFILGLAISMSAIVLHEIFDITIRAEDDITTTSKLPILSTVPDMSAPSKGGYYYGKNKKHDEKKTAASKKAILVGADISFSATEAYKLLRTKLQFSFTDENPSRVIGVSSALAGEGKSLTAINLAYSLSQLDKRVLLIDCDMRRPSVADKLPVAKTPGLSNYLSGQSALDGLFQNCGIPNEEEAFKVIAAGRNPPNPVELLSSARMNTMLDHLRERFDYIILDLPPVGEVSDALAVAKVTDGILLVVRENYGNRIAYADTVRQFEFVCAKLLGVVYNYTSEHTGSYNRRYYGRKYYGRRYYGAYNRAKSGASDAAEQKTEM